VEYYSLSIDFWHYPRSARTYVHSWVMHCSYSHW